MSGEPLWRGPTDEYGDLKLVAITDRRAEVEVWRAGDRPAPPTRDQVRQALKSWLVRTPAVSFDWRDEDDAVDGATDAVMELLTIDT